MSAESLGAEGSVNTHRFIVRVGRHDRLGWYRDARYSWDDRWIAVEDLQYLICWTKASQRILKRTFPRYLPKEGRILEAGCGLGQWVTVLREWGYDVEGIDLSSVAIQRALAAFPGLPLYEGDAFDLHYPDSHFAAYISLGVVEHTEEGPQIVLQEAYRVLASGGVLLCAVPDFNLVRRIITRRSLPVLALDQIPHDGLDFYQWAFTSVEFREILDRAGFEVKAAVPYAVRKTLRDEFPFFNRMDSQIVQKRSASVVKARRFGVAKKLATIVLDNALLRSIAGHMRIYIACKR